MQVQEYNRQLKQKRECGRCPMLGRTFVGVDSFDGLVHHVPVMFLGLNPGRDEAVEGLPFVGKAGQFLRYVIKDTGVCAWMMTNSLLCSSPNEATITNADAARASCRQNLAVIFKDFLPKIIVPLGNGAWSIFQTGVPISRAQEMLFYSKGRADRAKETLVLPLTHPSALIRSGGKNSAQYPQFNKRLKFIAEVSQMDDPVGCLREAGNILKKCFTTNNV